MVLLPQHLTAHPAMLLQETSMCTHGHSRTKQKNFVIFIIGIPFF